VFNTPYDDSSGRGPPGLSYKVLTGRRDRLQHHQQHQGLAPFRLAPKANTTLSASDTPALRISAALGMAVAAAQRGRMPGRGHHRRWRSHAGMAFEALNHAGSLPTDLLIILNTTTCRFPRRAALSTIWPRLSDACTRTCAKAARRSCAKCPRYGNSRARSEEHIKGMVLPGTLSRNGIQLHRSDRRADVKALVSTLRNLQKLRGPQFLHVVTRKGKAMRRGGGPHQVAWSGAVRSGERNDLQGSEHRTTYSQIFGKWLCDMAELDPGVVGITPAMREGSGLVEFSKRFPERYYDVAIAEQHAVTFAAGLAAEGLKPVVAIYSTFLQRAYDQLIHDVALQNLPVILRSTEPGSSAATARPIRAATT